MRVKIDGQVIDNVIAIEEFCDAQPYYERVENAIRKWKLKKVVRGDRELTIITPDAEYYFTNKDYEIVNL